jgi:hypothetical protein
MFDVGVERWMLGFYVGALVFVAQANEKQASLAG